MMNNSRLAAPILRTPRALVTHVYHGGLRQIRSFGEGQHHQEAAEPSQTKAANAAAAVRDFRWRQHEAGGVAK
eukprot:CAMPEP_0172897866 /NCGR_PEP_ID=MMETSP1075-20121228/158490_1 /TAXON_ID=2916 /ORGANISM="Ceratium fusus, Strain PA161109" /LENGTH=72 /DNA_ID=CAMNT_0013753545 /DNA_START=120 /DNA_END=335 /DNA_ORIENTATION=-